MIFASDWSSDVCSSDLSKMSPTRMSTETPAKRFSDLRIGLKIKAMNGSMHIKTIDSRNGSL